MSKENKKDKNKLTPKMKRFCEEYIIDCNATQAAIRANYSEKTAGSQGQRLLKNVEAKKYIKELFEEVKKDGILSATDILHYFSQVVKGESVAEVLVTLVNEDGTTRAEKIKKNPDEKERLKAAQLLGKRYALFTEKQEIKVELPVVISGEENLED